MATLAVRGRLSAHRRVVSLDGGWPLGAGTFMAAGERCPRMESGRTDLACVDRAGGGQVSLPTAKTSGEVTTSS